MKQLFLHSRKGQAIIEFVLGLSLLLFLLCGIVDIVRMGVMKHTLEIACREGVRAAIVTPGFGTGSPVVRSRVKRVFHNTFNGYPITVSIINDFGGGGGGAHHHRPAVSGDLITVSADIMYTYKFAVLSGKTQAIRAEATGVYMYAG